MLLLEPGNLDLIRSMVHNVMFVVNEVGCQLLTILLEADLNTLTV